MDTANIHTQEGQRFLGFAAKAWLALLLLSGPTACMTSPGSETTVSSTTARIAFSGYVPGPDYEITLQAARSRSGPFSSWSGSTTPAAASGIPWYGYEMHPWNLGARIPADRWAALPIIEGCSVPTTFVRAMTGGFALKTFDEPGLAGPTCMAPYEDDLAAAVTACASERSPVLQIRARNSVVGNVTITSEADLLAHRCTQLISGNLSIPDSLLMSVHLPLLEEVTGDVSIFMKVQEITTPPLGRFGAREILLPKLHRIGRSLSYTQVDLPRTFAGLPINLGLEHLTMLGRGLSIQLGVRGVSVSGLGSLTELSKLRLSYTRADVAGSLLANLQTVRGDVTISGGYSVIGLLPALATVGGDLRLQDFGGGGSFSAVLPSLHTVAGTVELDAVGMRGLGALMSTGGLEIRDRYPTFGRADPWSVRVPSLTIQGGVSQLANNLRLTANAPVTITGTALPLATICNFLQEQPDYTAIPAPDLGGAVCAGL